MSIIEKMMKNYKFLGRVLIATTLVLLLFILMTIILRPIGDYNQESTLFLALFIVLSLSLIIISFRRAFPLEIKTEHMKAVIYEVNTRQAFFIFISQYLERIIFNEFRLYSRFDGELLSGRILHKGYRICRILMEMDTGVFEIMTRQRKGYPGPPLMQSALEILKETVESLNGKIRIVS